MTLALQVLADLGTTVYAGTVLAFTALMLFRARVGPSERVVRVFRAWGPGQGLAMGALILGHAGLYYLQMGAFEWAARSPAEIAVIVQHVVFVVLWFSSFHLEIWTLEPTRKLDVDGAITDRDAYEKAARKATVQLVLNSLLLLVCGGTGLYIDSL